MTPTEARAWSAKVDRWIRRIVEEMTADQRLELLRTLPFYDSAVVAAVSYVLNHGLNLVWLHGLTLGKIRDRTDDPNIRREIAFSLSHDDFRIVRLDEVGEEELRRMRERAWDGLFARHGQRTLELEN